jgi:hypothetical protein
MSYAVQQPAAAEAPHPRRPATVGFAAVLLAVMGVGGLAYAVATLAVTPTVVNRFRGAAGPASSTDIDSMITVVWVGAAIAGALAVILFALYVVLALGLRRGSNASRIGVWVLCGLGLLAGCGTTVTVLVERSGTGTPGSLGVTLSDAYPGGWIGLDVALAIVQMVGYVVIAVLLIVSPAAFFGRGRAHAPSGPTYAGIPPYGAASAPYGPPSPYGPGVGPRPGPPYGPGPGAPHGPGAPYGPGTAPYGPGTAPYGPGTAPYGPGVGPYGPGVPPGYGAPPAGFSNPPSGSTGPIGNEGASGYAPPLGSGWLAGDEAVSGYAPPAEFASRPDPGAAAEPSVPPTSPAAAQPPPGPEDEYWSRPAG